MPHEPEPNGIVPHGLPRKGPSLLRAKAASGQLVAAGHQHAPSIGRIGSAQPSELRPLEAKGYTKVRQVGKGAFGRALLVRTMARELCVAKEINLDSLSTSEKEMARTEIRVLRTLDHPNVIRYVDHFEETGLLYIIMEFADSGDLGRLLRGLQQPMPEDQILDIFTQVCLALAHVHGQHIMHRDLKPQNVFLTDGRKTVKLGDFGISTILSGAQASAKAQCGTPYYFSPEVCQHQPYNTKSDVWSLGCLLYEMVTLRRPFDGANMKALMANICKGTYPPPPAHFSSELQLLVGCLLTRDPHQRPSVAQVLTLPFIRKHAQALPTQAEAKAFQQQTDKEQLLRRLRDALGHAPDAVSGTATMDLNKDGRPSGPQRRRPVSAGIALRSPPPAGVVPIASCATRPVLGGLASQVHRQGLGMAVVRRPVPEEEPVITLGDLPSARHQCVVPSEAVVHGRININVNINLSHPGQYLSTAPEGRSAEAHLRDAPRVSTATLYQRLVLDADHQGSTAGGQGSLEHLQRLQAQLLAHYLAQQYPKANATRDDTDSSREAIEERCPERSKLPHQRPQSCGPRYSAESGAQGPAKEDVQGGYGGVKEKALDVVGQRKRRIPSGPLKVPVCSPPRNASPTGSRPPPGESSATLPQGNRSRCARALHDALGFGGDQPPQPQPQLQVPIRQSKEGAATRHGMPPRASSAPCRTTSERPHHERTSTSRRGPSEKVGPSSTSEMVDLLLDEPTLSHPSTTPEPSGTNCRSTPRPDHTHIKHLQEKLRKQRQQSGAALVTPDQPMVPPDHEQLLDDLLNQLPSATPVPRMVQHPRVQLITGPPSTLHVQPKSRFLQVAGQEGLQRSAAVRRRRNTQGKEAIPSSSTPIVTPTPQATHISEPPVPAQPQQPLLHRLRQQQEQHVRRLQLQQQRRQMQPSNSNSGKEAQQ